jgi:hypothetical protein
MGAADQAHPRTLQRSPRRPWLALARPTDLERLRLQRSVTRRWPGEFFQIRKADWNPNQFSNPDLLAALDRLNGAFERAVAPTVRVN